LLESAVNFRHILWLRRPKFRLGDVELVLLHHSREVAGNGGDVHGQLAASVMDLECGCHESFCAGTRSRTRFVVAASSRNSFAKDSAIGAIFYLLFAHWIFLYACIST
jgi:hypothetical protein